jgi:fructose-bisphosphate aldolase class II
MQNLKELIFNLNKDYGVVWHFNVSDISMIYGVVEAVKKANKPVILGLSEGERNFLGIKPIISFINTLKKEHNLPIFLNADHSYSLESVKEAIDAGFDSVIFDGAALPLEENILKTKEIVLYARKKNPNVLVEAELGYIGSHSKILENEELDILSQLKYAEINDVIKFVNETQVDMFAPAVGNIHGIALSQNKILNPKLNIDLIKEIKQKTNLPLVLHGGSGIALDDFIKAVQAGINIIHISTELRVAWKAELLKSLEENKEEYAPYKIYKPVVSKISEIVLKYLNLI